MDEVQGQMVVYEPGTARLNITWNGQNGDLVDPIPFDVNDEVVRELATEAVRTGSVPGIATDMNASFADFVVDRFPPTEDVTYARISLRPKTPFGR
jgi:hypothetical protein